MPKQLLIETSDKSIPILLLCGNNNPIISHLLKEYTQDFKVAHITSVTSHKTYEQYYRILPESAYLIDNLEDSLGYAVIFLEDEKDKTVLHHVLPKLEREQTKTLIIIDLAARGKFYDMVLELKKKEYIKFAFIGDVFGQSIPLSNSNISKIIQNAILKKIVSLSGNTSSPEFCISDADCFAALNHILFSHESKKQFFYLFYERPQTYTSVIHLLGRVEPGLSVDFTNEEAGGGELDFSDIETEIESKTLVKPSFLDKYFLGFEKSVRLIAQSKKPIEIYTEETKDETVKKKRNFSITRISWTPAFFIALLLFVLIHVVFASLSFFMLRQAKAAFEKKDFSRAQKLSNDSILFASPLRPSAEVAAGFLSLVTGKGGASIGFIDHAFDVFTQTTSLAGKLSTLQSGVDQKNLSEIISSATYLFFELQNIRLDKNTQFPTIFTQPEYSRLLSVSATLPPILGFDRDKTYLLLFQNNGELRPTGGFIGSIGEITFSKGKIKEFHIDDVYNVDGQLKAHVEPHYIVRRYLQPHLYLRDSNFALSFENTASTSALIYDLALQKKVDGVVGITFEAVRQIIKTVGPIRLSNYSIVLDENNTFDFLQNQIESNKFPGTSRKKEVLQALFNNLSLKFEQDKNNFYKVGYLIPQLLSSKDILLAFSTNSVQKGFSVNGFSGSFFDPRDKTSENIYDVFSVNEANIGVNKANVAIDRQVDYDVFLTKGGITSKGTLTLKSTTQDAPDYKAYVRFISPPGSFIKSIVIDGIKQTVTTAITDYKIYEGNKFVPPVGLEVDTTRESDLTSFGFITTVIAGKTQKIEVEYVNAVTQNIAGLFKYSLLFVKQPGTSAYPLTLKLHYSDDFTPQNVENAILDKNIITIKETVTGDREFNMSLIKR